MTKLTIKNIDRDFSEWHGGISHYGFWAVSIENKAWEAALNSAANVLADYLLEGYARTPHITIFACGLLDENFFSSAMLRVQKQQLQAMNIPPFSLSISHLKSFSSCPVLGVNDDSEVIRRIRTAFNVISKEDRQSAFEAHLTLGLYKDAFSLADIQHQLDSIKLPALEPITVNRIDFCTYRSNEIQGRIEIVDSVTCN